MKKSLIISLIGVLINLTAFSQLQADRKIDSLYCFGPQKAKQLAELKASEESLQQMYSDCQMESFYMRKANEKCDSIVSEKIEVINNQKKEIKEKENQISINETKYKKTDKQLKKSKLKTIGIGIGAGLSIIGNIVLVTKIIIDK